MFDWSNISRYCKLPNSEFKYYFLVVSVLLSTVFSLNLLFLVVIRYNEINDGYQVVKVKWDLACSPQTSSIIFLGDSSGDQGIAPSVVKEEIRCSSLNLCTLGNLLLVDDLWLLESYLEKSPSPQSVVLVHVYDVWHRKSPNIGALRQIPISTQAWDELTPIVDLGWFWKTSILIDQFIPMYSRRLTLHQFIWHPSELMSERNELEFTEYGFRPCKVNSLEGTIADRENHLKFVSENNFIPSMINSLAYQKIIEHCKKHNIRLFVASSPLDEKLASDQFFQGYYNELQQWLEKSSNGHPHVTVISELFLVPEHELERVDHVTVDAAHRYSRWLAEKIKSMPEYSHAQ